MMPEPIRVIYVDDDPDLLEIGKIFLEKTGEFIVTIAESAEDAISVFREQSFDAIISDYQMPGMDGIEFLKHLRSSKDTTPFIIFTGKGREDVVIQALNEGANFYLQKGGETKSQFAELSNKIRYAVSRRQGEKRLLESEERYKNVVETQSEFICRFLPDGTHLFVNEAYCRRFNTNPQEIIGTRFKPVIHTDDRDAVSCLFASLTPNHPIGTIEQRTILPDRGVVWDRWSTRAFFNEDGTVREYQSVGSDITGRKLTEKALAESEREKELILNNTGDIIAYHDRNRCLVWANQTYLDGIGSITGIPVRMENIKGHHCCEAWRLTKPCIGCPVTIALQTGETCEAEMTPENQPHWPATQGSWNVKASPVRDTQGNVIGAIEVSRNITDRKRAEEDLFQNRTMLHEVLNAIPQSVFWKDRDCRYLGCNMQFAQAVGLENPDLIVGKTDFDLPWPQEEADSYLRDDHFVMDRNSPRSHIIEPLQQADGSRLWIDTTKVPLTDGQGNVYGVLGIYEDVTERKGILEALAESESFNRGLIENLPDYVSVYGMDGKLLYVNPASAKALGYDADTLIGMQILSFIAEEYRETVIANIIARKEGEEVPPYELELVARNGARRSVIVKAAPIQYQNHPATLLLLIDITDRRAAEAALRESEEKYHLIAENTADHIWIFDMDLTMTYSSPSVTRMKGFTVEETLSQSFEEMMTPGSFEMALKRFHEEIAQEAAGTADPDRTISLETEEYCKDGRIIIVENVATLLRDCAQKPVGILGVSRDITDRKRAEEALRESEERFRVAQEMSPDGFTILHPVRNKKGEIIDFMWIYENQTIARLNKTDPQEVIGKRLLDLFPGHIGTSVFQAYINAANTGIPQIIEEISVSEIFSNPTWLRLVIISMGEDIAILAQDITNRKATEQALREVNKKLNILSSITRHDINNQLSIILGSLDLLEENADRNDVESITMASTAAKRISSMIQFTREYEMIGVNTPVWHDLKNLIETVAGKVHLGSIRAECIIPAGLLIYADPLITTVFYNIIENAVRYGEKISEIRLFSRQSGDEMVIVCEDDGNGISDGQKEKIFEKGFGKNTGMGLFLSREILSITGISIRETGTYGEGARFLITVPEGKYHRPDHPDHSRGEI